MSRQAPATSILAAMILAAPALLLGACESDSNGDSSGPAVSCIYELKTSSSCTSGSSGGSWSEGCINDTTSRAFNTETDCTGACCFTTLYRNPHTFDGSCSDYSDWKEAEARRNCVPSCESTECGPDGCGGQCGTCEADEVCYEEVLCLDDCGICIADNCLSQAQACSTGSECSAAGLCIADCDGDTACKQNCTETQGQQAVDLYNVFIGCIWEDCQAECY